MGEVWFITEPTAFQESHFPFEGNDKYVSKSNRIQYEAYRKWVNGPHIKPAFFGYGMKRISYEKGVIETVSNQVQVMFRCSCPMHIFHKLKSVDDPSTDLNKFVVYFTDGDKVVVKANLPRKGEYDFKIYGFPEGTSREVQTSYRTNLIGYRIIASGWKFQQPFPDMKNGRLGPEWNFLKAGYRLLSPTLPIIEAKDGRAFLTIERRKGPIKDVYFKFYHNSDLKETLSSCLFPETSKNSVKVHMLCQRPGQYKLEIYVKFVDKSHTFDYSGCFLVHSSTKPSILLEEFPKADINRRWGPGQELLDSGFDISFPRTSLLPTDNGQGELVMRCSQETYKRSEFIHEVFTADGVKIYDCVMAKVVFDQGSANVSFHLRLKKTGFYIFKLGKIQDGSNKYDLAGEWLVRCDKPYKGKSFPKRNNVYGPNSLFHNLDLELVSPMASYIEALNGECNLVMKCKRATYDKLDIYVKVVSDNTDPKQAEHSILGDATFDDEFVIVSFSFRLVEQGLTVVQLWARSNDWDSDKYRNAGDWLIDCRNAYKGQLFPKFDEIYGPKRLFTSLGLRLVSPMTSRMISNDGKAKLVVRCSRLAYRKLQIFHEAIAGEARIKNCIQADAVFERDEVTVSFYFKLANHGFTTMRLLANTDGSNKVRTAGVWLVECRKPYQGQLFEDFDIVHGPNFKFFDMGLELVSPSSSRVEIKRGKGDLVVRCKRTVYEKLEIYSSARSDGFSVTNNKEISFEGDSVLIVFHLNLANISFKSVDVWAKLKDAEKYEHVGKWSIDS